PRDPGNFHPGFEVAVALYPLAIRIEIAASVVRLFLSGEVLRYYLRVGIIVMESAFLLEAEDRQAVFEDQVVLGPVARPVPIVGTIDVPFLLVDGRAVEFFIERFDRVARDRRPLAE